MWTKFHVHDINGTCTKQFIITVSLILVQWYCYVVLCYFHIANLFLKYFITWKAKYLSFMYNTCFVKMPKLGVLSLAVFRKNHKFINWLFLWKFSQASNILECTQNKGFFSTNCQICKKNLRIFLTAFDVHKIRGLTKFL